MPSIQFPWRFMLVPALASSLCVGALLHLLDGKPASFVAGLAAAVTLLMLVSYAPFAKSACKSEELSPKEKALDCFRDI